MLYKTKPILIEKIWGGSRLKDYNKIFTGNLGESIEYSGESEGIPITIKLIDAKDNLSIQIHPDENVAKTLGDGYRGKDEFWIVLESNKGSEIYYGFNKIYNKEKLQKFLSEGLIIQILNRIKVKKGDCIFIPSGTVHAIGKGVMVYEIQQSSDITYRLYDWNRATEQKRELNIEKALYSIVHNTPPWEIKNIYDMMEQNTSIVDVVNCKHFKVRFVSLDSKESIMSVCDELKIITAISGIGSINSNEKKVVLKKGETCVVSQNFHEYVEITGISSFQYIESSCNSKEYLT